MLTKVDRYIVHNITSGKLDQAVNDYTVNLQKILYPETTQAYKKVFIDQFFYLTLPNVHVIKPIKLTLDVVLKKQEKSVKP